MRLHSGQLARGGRRPRPWPLSVLRVSWQAFLGDVPDAAHRHPDFAPPFRTKCRAAIAQPAGDRGGFQCNQVPSTSLQRNPAMRSLLRLIAPAVLALPMLAFAAAPEGRAYDVNIVSPPDLETVFSDSGDFQV